MSSTTPVSTSPPLVRTALLLLPMQAILRGGEALLPLVLAAWFGRGAATDLYYVLSAYFVFAAAALTGAFQDSGVVPVLIEVEREGPDRYATVASALFGFTLAIGAVVGLATGALAASVALFASHEPALAVELVLIMSVGVVATSVRSFFVGLLNARGAFHAHPLCSGTGAALTWVILFFARRPLGVKAIPLGMVAGELLAIALLHAMARRRIGVRIAPTLDRSEPVRRIFRLVRLEVTGSLITRINPVIDQLTAGLAGVVGGGTLLRYANDVASLPTSILQATVFPVLLTRLAREAQEPALVRETTRRTLGVVAVLLVVFAGLVAALRRPLSALLFLHGAMDAGGVARIADVLPWALLGAAPFGALLVLARAHVALQNSRIMPSMGVLNAVLNAAFNLVFVRALGLAGIALSTSITYAVVAVVFWVRLPSVGLPPRQAPPSPR